jgi:hypothetical protein
MSKRLFILAHEQARQRAVTAVMEAPAGYSVTISEPARNLDQNAKFHAICTDLEKSGLEWMGKPRKREQWKVLLVSGHAIATKEGADIMPGIEGEFVNLRESTALMSKTRSSSLIEYSIAFAVSHGVELREDPCSIA